MVSLQSLWDCQCGLVRIRRVAWARTTFELMQEAEIAYERKSHVLVAQRLYVRSSENLHWTPAWVCFNHRRSIVALIAKANQAVFLVPEDHSRKAGHVRMCAIVFYAIG